MRNIFIILFCTIIFIIPTISQASNKVTRPHVDLTPPVITNVELISENGGGYDTTPPGFAGGYFNFGGRGTVVVGEVGKNITFNINVFDNLTGVSQVIVQIVKPNGISEDFTTTFDDTVGIAQLILAPTDSEIGNWTISKIIAEDLAGNKSEFVPAAMSFYILPSWYTLFKDTPLVITNNYNVIKTSFSEEIDPLSLNKDHVLLIESSVESASNDFFAYKRLDDFEIKIAEDKRSFNLIRTNPYDSSKMYTLVIHDNVKDLQGNKISNPMFINFRYAN